jgi:hypothetical protein
MERRHLKMGTVRTDCGGNEDGKNIKGKHHEKGNK